ncbi:MAG: GNAT family N-acetyltransferase [Chloroflexota bacterium]
MFDFSYFPVLNTGRLILNEISNDDIPALYALFSDPEVTRYNDVNTFTSEDDARWVLRFLRQRFGERGGVRWAIRLRSHPHTLIGTAGYNVWTRHNFCCELGYDLMRSHWRRGYMTEAVQEIIRFGFREMAVNRVEANVMVGNYASARVLQKLGFTEEGVMRQRGCWKGSFHDLRLFSLLRSEYNQLEYAG